MRLFLFDIAVNLLCFYSATEQVMSDGSPPLLTGKTSQEMKLRIDSLQCDPRIQVLCWFSKFFAVSFTLFSCKGRVQDTTRQNKRNLGWDEGFSWVRSETHQYSRILLILQIILRKFD